MKTVFASTVNRTLVLFALAVAGVMLAAGATFEARPATPSITVYKSPTCGCCSLWVDHLRMHDFNVRAIDVNDLDTVKRTYAVPPQLSACHTAIVEGYVVEGHVPADAVARMLRERPAIVGIAVPGMPIGSPGMEVPGRSEAYEVVSFDRSGHYEVYERR